MDIAKAFEVAFNRKIEKNWEKIYVVVDIHDTILRACYENEETYDYYPYSRETLQLMTNREDICLILWSGCYDDKMNEYRAHFAAGPPSNTDSNRRSPRSRNMPSEWYRGYPLPRRSSPSSSQSCG